MVVLMVLISCGITVMLPTHFRGQHELYRPSPSTS